MTKEQNLREKILDLLEKKDSRSVDYFGVIKELVEQRGARQDEWQDYIDKIYDKVLSEILFNDGRPVTTVKFGTSGWRGVLGKDLFCKSVAQVTLAIIEMYKELESDLTLAEVLGVTSFQEVQSRGCVIGFDNRFGEDALARVVVEVLDQEGIKIYFAGESTTGVLSASVLQLRAAFSINLTPSHNPLEYGGFKFNAADAGPAATEITDCITSKAQQIILEDRLPSFYAQYNLPLGKISDRVERIDSFKLWKEHVTGNHHLHGLDYDLIMDAFAETDDLVVVIDSVHGASRLHIHTMFKEISSSRLIHLRGEKDVTFGGVSPEPSSANMKGVVSALQKRDEKYKLGAIIDPDGDRIRFTDGSIEISMNQFGAMAYHFLHEVKKKRGMVAKTVATSNLANSLAKGFNEEVFEPRVGFKEFKPVIGRALVCFEESDGISIIGHTPEKDAYIGLLLALDMILSTGKSLGAYLLEIEGKYGSYYPERDGVEVSLKGNELLQALSGLQKYDKGDSVKIGSDRQIITEVIDIDGRKMIFEDGSWLMIRPSGTEPKVRFYVESRTADGTENLVEAAKSMLSEIGLL